MSGHKKDKIIEIVDLETVNVDTSFQGLCSKDEQTNGAKV